MSSTYRAYVFDKHDYATNTHDIQAKTDQEAVTIAAALIAWHDVEVWHGYRLVTRLFGPDKKPRPS
jgi:uncharacterized protein YchJ